MDALQEETKAAVASLYNNSSEGLLLNDKVPGPATTHAVATEATTTHIFCGVYMALRHDDL